MSHIVTNIIEHNATVKEFHLRRRDGAALPDWRPGSHVVLRFSSADGDLFEKHYSLIGMPGLTDTYRIAVQREENGKGGSITLHDEITTGSQIGVSNPVDNFPLKIQSQQGRILLIAGGIGITPMISMACALTAQNIPFTLHYLVSDEKRLILLDELRAIPNIVLHYHGSLQSGRANLEEIVGPYQPGDSFYACGPAGLLQGLAEAGVAKGWPVDAMQFESFGARAEIDDVPLTVELSLSEVTVEVAPGTSILDALIAAEVFVSYDCQRGECGQCYTTVLEGEALHRDVCLTPDMRSTGMCPCVSWAKKPGRLVLEI